MLDSFTWGQAKPTQQDDLLQAVVPPGINSKQILLESLAERLSFPDYFGENWDALSECLRDLSWIDRRVVVITHQDLPLLPTEDVLTYLSVLAFAIEHWAADGEHHLIVEFPLETREVVQALWNAARGKQ